MFFMYISLRRTTQYFSLAGKVSYAISKKKGHEKNKTMKGMIIRNFSYSM
jgi:hypothetical protein